MKHTIEERAAALSFIIWSGIVAFVIIAWLLGGCVNNGISYSVELQLCTGQYDDKGACITTTAEPSPYEEGEK